MPWLQPILANQGLQDPDGLVGAVPSLPHPIRLVLSVIVVGIAIMVPAIGYELYRKNHSLAFSQIGQIGAALWLLGPFSLVYFLLLLPRAGHFIIQDRYLLGLMPAGIVLLLLAHQHWVAPAVPRLSVAVLAVFCVFAVCGTHDTYAERRAGERR